jgi:hypothetical protein
MKRREIIKKTGIATITGSALMTTASASPEPAAPETADSSYLQYYDPDGAESFGSSDSADDSFVEVWRNGTDYQARLWVEADLSDADYSSRCGYGKDHESVYFTLEMENYESGFGYYWSEVDTLSVAVESPDTVNKSQQYDLYDSTATGNFRIETWAEWHFNEDCYDDQAGWYDSTHITDQFTV